MNLLVKCGHFLVGDAGTPKIQCISRLCACKTPTQRFLKLIENELLLELCYMSRIIFQGMMSTTGRGSSPQRHPNEGQSNQVTAPRRPVTPHSARTAAVQRVQSAGTSRRPGSAGAHIPSAGREETESQSEAQPHTNTPIPPNVS